MMKVPAIYVPPGGGAPISLGVRDHTEIMDLGQSMSGENYPQIAQSVPKLVILAEDLDPARNGIFWLSPADAYAVERDEPAYGITRTVYVTRLTPSELANQTPPEGLE